MDPTEIAKWVPNHAGEITHVGMILGLLAAAFWSFMSHRQSRQVNDSVNHRHETGTPRIYDLMISVNKTTERTEARVDELIEWKRTYDGGPLADGLKVREFVDQMQRLKMSCDQCGTDLNPKKD